MAAAADEDVRCRMRKLVAVLSLDTEMLQDVVPKDLKAAWWKLVDELRAV